jgi:hypothetical protein
MEVEQIAAAAGLRVRTVKYAIAHKFVPWVRGVVVPNRAGRPRRFNPYEAFTLAAASVFFERGMRRELVFDVMQWLELTRWPVPQAPTVDDPWEFWPPPTVVGQLLNDKSRKAAVEVGDGRALCVSGSEPTDWFDLRTCKRMPSYKPMLTIRLDVAALRHALASYQGGPNEK